jgi:hypothetical protein
MRDLKELHIEGFHDNTVPKDILTDCPFQLLSFSWTNQLPASTLKNVLRFLETQRDIRHLGSKIAWDPCSVPLALPTCEALEHLEGDRGAIETFLPGRKVTSLVWIPSWGDPTDDIRHLEKEFAALQKVSFYTTFGSGHIVGFDVVASYLQNLWYLELSTFASLQFSRGELVHDIFSRSGFWPISTSSQTCVNSCSQELFNISGTSLPSDGRSLDVAIFFLPLKLNLETIGRPYRVNSNSKDMTETAV